MIEKIKKSFRGNLFKKGVYTTTLTIIVLVAVVAINLLANKLDYKIDLSKDSLYTLTKQSNKLAKENKNNIVIYYIAGEKTTDDRVEEILKQYAAISSKIKIEKKDPEIYPKFTSDYVDEEVTENSVIVVNKDNKKNKYVPYADMIETEVDYQTYQTYEKALDVEGQISSAISYVTSEKLPTMYVTEGHGEAEINATIASSIAKENVNTKTINTLTVDEIPNDCAILLINGAVRDFTSDETKVIKDYLSKGKSAIILTDYTTEEMPNFTELLKYYGVKLEKGIVMEGDTNYCMSNNPAYLIPEYGANDITTDLYNKNQPVVMPLAQGIKILENKRETLEVSPLLTTSESAFSKVDVDSASYEQTSEDIKGPFNLGVSITDKNNDKETKIAVYGTSYLLDEKMTEITQLGNTELFLTSIKKVADLKNDLAISSRSTMPGRLLVTGASATFFSAIVLVIIPAIFLILGAVVWVKRRKK